MIDVRMVNEKLIDRGCRFVSEIAKISYEEVRESFKETSDVVQSRFRQIIGTISEGCEIYADMTYGPKTLTPVLFYALGFAEKFFDADIKNPHNHPWYDAYGTQPWRRLGDVATHGMGCCRWSYRFYRSYTLAHPHTLLYSSRCRGKGQS